MNNLFIYLAMCLALAPSAPGEDAARPVRSRYDGLPVLSVSIFGYDRLDRGIVLRASGLRIGEPWSRALADSARAGIERLAAVESVSIRRIHNRGEKGVRLIVRITEGSTRSIEPVARRNAANRVGFGLGAVEKSFRGRNEHLAAWFTLRGATTIAASWHAPSLAAAPRIGLGLQAGWSGYDYPFPDAGSLLVDERIDRFEAALSCRLRFPGGCSVVVAPGLDLIDVAEPMVAGDWLAGAPDQPAGLFTTLETAVELDRLGRRFYPRRGLFFSIGRRDWGILQPDAAMKNFLWKGRGALFLPLGRAIAAIVVEGGFAHGRVPLLLRRHIGGENTLRGHEFGAFAGERSIVQRTELRVPLNFSELADIGNPMVLVDLHVFWDAGAAWNRPEAFDTDLIHSGFGCGMHFIPRAGLLATVGYAWRLDTSGDWYLDLSTGF
ncbi:MAG: BamA/TamA family outer membrane protein [Candidatus Krumholzibacteriota bacterium]|nr:BamA/TamA family outer membrane protein [Candidatus Krumholzibacteriota bacterium]